MEKGSSSKDRSQLVPSIRQRNYRQREDSDSDDDSDSPDLALNRNDLEEPSGDTVWSVESTPSGTDTETVEQQPEPAPGTDDTTFREANRERDEEDLPPVLSKPKPSNKWIVIKELNQKTLGTSCQKTIENVFNKRCHGSLRFVKRLELASKMDLHNGCVNALHFNSSGSKLASGSDDLNIIIWDWARADPLLTYNSGHRGNVFQAKFLPLCGDMHIVSCARDGHIRMAELTSGGTFHSTRRLALHRGPAHKLALLVDTPQVFLSAGEDAVVFEVDVRQSKPNKLLTVKSGERKVALYSIHSHPIDTNEFCVGGRDQYVRIYDRRRLVSETQSPLKSYCPRHLLDSSVRAHVTSAVYNFNGSELLASYNDEDIYLFSTRHSDVADVLHCFQGHRNNATVKGVNFYGPRSEFVVSGSDCGNIFFWDKQTEAIVQCVPGDENGVVNCLEPHPSIPVLATSGLDDEVKIWAPNNFDEPQLWDLKNTVKNNQREREEERRREPDTIDGEMLWILWRHIRRTERRRRMQQQQQQQQQQQPRQQPHQQSHQQPHQQPQQQQQLQEQQQQPQQLQHQQHHHQHRRSSGQADEDSERNRLPMSSSSEESDDSENDYPRGVQCAPS